MSPLCNKIGLVKRPVHIIGLIAPTQRGEGISIFYMRLWERLLMGDRKSKSLFTGIKSKSEEKHNGVYA